MLPSLSLPPLECCFGTSPIQAEKLRPDRKVLGQQHSRPERSPASDRPRECNEDACSFGCSTKRCTSYSARVNATRPPAKSTALELIPSCEIASRTIASKDATSISPK